MVHVIERGWSGYLQYFERCLFRRNTLLETSKGSVVVVSIGSMFSTYGEILPVEDSDVYFKTEVFLTKTEGPYTEPDITAPLIIKSQHRITANKILDIPYDVDNQANEMHEGVVTEFIRILESEVDLHDLIK